MNPSPPPAGGSARFTSESAYEPCAQFDAKFVCALLIARSDPIADASLPDWRARSRPGTAMAAMMPMIATTMSSSISVNPSFFFRRIMDRVSCFYRVDWLLDERGQRRRNRIRHGRGVVVINGPAVIARKRARARLATADRVGTDEIHRARRRRRRIAGGGRRQHVTITRIPVVGDGDRVAALRRCHDVRLLEVG